MATECAAVSKIEDKVQGESNIVCEGLAEIVNEAGDAFYNQAMQFNRDITIVVLRLLSAEVQKSIEQIKSTGKTRRNGTIPTGLSILDALSASGLRAIRFAREVAGIESVIANDMSESAVQSIKKNILHNKVQHLVSTECSDAGSVLFSHRQFGRQFHAVDLDPFGSPSQFLDAAVQAVQDDGLLMVTCTDVSVLCGGHTPEACFAKYGASSVRSGAMHEMGVRIVLGCLDTHAARYARYITPVCSISIDYYIRVFVRLNTGAAKAKDNMCHRNMVFVCSGCESIHLQPLVTKEVNGKSVRFHSATGPVVGHNCEHCKGNFKIGGPIWGAPIHDLEFVRLMMGSLSGTPDTERLGTHHRILAMLTLVAQELSDVPLMWDLKRLTHVCRVSMPRPDLVICALLNAGARVSLTHSNTLGIKTDAKPELIWNVIRAYAQTNEDFSLERLDKNSAAYNIMCRPITQEIDFTEIADVVTTNKQLRSLHGQFHALGWGPKAKTKGSVCSSLTGFYNEGLRKRQMPDDQGAAMSGLHVNDNGKRCKDEAE